MNRAFFDICLFLSIFILPWWVALVLSLIGIYVYEQFYESVIAMILMKIIYGTTGSRIITSNIYFPLIVIGAYYILSVIKKSIFIKNS